MRWMALMAMGTVMLSCSAPPPPPPPPLDAGPTTTFTPDSCKRRLDDSAAIAVGEGQLSFHALEGGEELTWEPGPQGGHHIWVALRQTGLRQSGTILTMNLTAVELPGQPVITERRVVFDWRREEGGFCVLPGLRMQLDEDPDVDLALLDDQLVRISVTARDPDGSEAYDSTTVRVRAPSADAGM